MNIKEKKRKKNNNRDVARCHCEKNRVSHFYQKDSNSIPVVIVVV